MSQLQQNLASVRERIAQACKRAGRKPEDVQLVAVTKTVPAEIVAQLPALGVTIVGENRVQEAAEKIPQVSGLRWHLIGSLQSNKAKKANAMFEAIHSVDRIELVDALKDPVQVFIEVNVAGETSKHGVKPDEAQALVDRIRRFHPHLALQGLMTMAPLGEDSRPHFKRLATLAKECGVTGLSMGMSGDFEIAIEEGATHVRIGTALFKGA